MNNELAQAIASQKDAILYELFGAQGYTRTKVKNLVAKNRIDILVQGNVENLLDYYGKNGLRELTEKQIQDYNAEKKDPGD